MNMLAKLMDAARQDKRRATIVAVIAVALLGVLVIWQVATSDSGRQKVLSQAMLRLLNAESFHTMVDFNLDLPTAAGRERRLVDLAVDIEGDVVWQEGVPEFAGDMRIETTGRGIILFADGDLRLQREAVVFRLDNLPTILNPNGNLVEKWTYVEVPTLQTQNAEQVRAAMVNVVSDMEFVGKDEVEGRELWHFRRGFTEEQEAALIEVFRQGKSGNRTLHVLARLLRAYNVDSFDVWVDDEDKVVQKVTMTFVERVGDNPEQAASLALTFDEYGKSVSVEQPPKELTVKPEVFGRIFGRGEVPELEGAN